MPRRRIYSKLRRNRIRRMRDQIVILENRRSLRGFGTRKPSWTKAWFACMRKFNKVFIIALPRCATVSLCDALGMLGLPTAHLGRIYGEKTKEHNNPARMKRMYEQITKGDFQLDILEQCVGLADYPVCSTEVFSKLDSQYPGSLFINLKRDGDVGRWLQSVERQFVGLQMVKAGKTATEDEKEFMKVMLYFRELTFGQAKFDASAYEHAYRRYQAHLSDYFAGRTDFLNIADISELETCGFEQLCEFLECEKPESSFPRSNDHSDLPYRAFMQALEEGRITSQTGIRPVGC